MPKRSDERSINEREGMRYCRRHERYYHAEYGCQKCLLDNLERRAAAKNVVLFECPACEEAALWWNEKEQHYECLECGQLFVKEPKTSIFRHIKSMLKIRQ